MADGGYHTNQLWWDAAGRAWLARDAAATAGLESYQRRQFKDRPEYWDGERANFAQQYGGTSAVGCFPAGPTREGVLDLAGNVWEWTRSVYADYPYDPDDGREATDEPARKHFTLRGGGWVN